MEDTNVWQEAQNNRASQPTLEAVHRETLLQQAEQSAAYARSHLTQLENVIAQLRSSLGR